MFPAKNLSLSSDISDAKLNGAGAGAGSGAGAGGNGFAHSSIEGAASAAAAPRAPVSPSLVAVLNAAGTATPWSFVASLPAARVDGHGHTPAMRETFVKLRTMLERFPHGVQASMCAARDD